MSADWRQQEELEHRRWVEMHQRWYCIFCGKEVADQTSAHCGEVGATEPEAESERRWAELNEEHNHGHP